MKKNYRTIYFIRHGETVWNTEKRLQGQLDSPLTANGILQIESLLTELKKLPISKILSSPLGRATASAKIISQHFKIPLEIIDVLKERNFGNWQGELFEGLKSKELFNSVLLNVNDDKPNGGESGLNCAKRMHDYLMSKINNESFNHSLIMTHGEILRCFLSQLPALNEKNNEQLNADAYSQYRNGRIFKVVYFPQKQKFHCA